MIASLGHQKNIPNHCYKLIKVLFENYEPHEDFNVIALANIIPQLDFKVYASSGINLSNLDSIQNIGFHGIATMGSIWFNDEKQPISHCKDFTNKLTTLS